MSLPPGVSWTQDDDSLEVTVAIDSVADGLTRAHDLEAVAEGEKRGAYGYN